MPDPDRGECAACGHPFSEHYYSVKYSQAGEQIGEEDGCAHDLKTCKCAGYTQVSNA